MNILVPIDFSDLSLKALQIANQYASLFNGKITPFHSYVPVSEVDEPYAMGVGGESYQNIDKLDNILRERVTDITSRIVDKQLLTDPVITMGNPAHSIIDASEDYDYIIMSTHGRTGFTRFLLGSVAEKVLRLAHIPVMIIENESDIGNLENILVTTDFSENSAAAYPYALEISKTCGSSVDLLHVISSDQFDEEESDLSIKKIREERLKLVAKEYFHEISDRVKTRVIVSRHSPHEAIYKHVKSISCNLIVMATVGRTGINYLMMGSTTGNVVRHVKTAVLSINPRQQQKI